MSTSTLRVAIIGAGPGGCMLARLLTRGPDANRISVTVFEAESSLDVRFQGGTLDLHAHSGLLAVKEAGLYDEFRKYARYDGEYMRICDKRNVTWMKMSASEPSEVDTIRSRPEIDRKELRRILMESVPGGVIRWGWKLRKIDDDLVMHFDNGMTEGGYDLIVGADGAWSKARAVVSDKIPSFPGLAGHDLIIPNVETAFPDVYKLVNRGTLNAISDGKGLLAQQLGDGNIMVYAWSVRSEDWMKTSPFDIHDHSQTKAAILKDFHDWDPQLLALIHSSAESTPRSLYVLPTGLRWTHRKGLTLIGDAAHLMSPFAGEGVNLALVDALDLSKVILSSLEDSGAALDDRIVEFEDEMVKRSESSQAEAEANMHDMFFVPGTPRTVLASAICRNLKDHMNPVLYPAVVAATYTVCFFYKRYVDIFF